MNNSKAQQPDNSRQIFERYLQAVLCGGFTQASQVVQEALQASVPAETIYDQIFTPSMREVGQRWQTGQMSVAQEHLATGITEYCRNIVYSKQHDKGDKPIGKVMLTSVEGNQHTLGLNLLSDVFRWRGWEVYPLFSALPDEEIASAALLYGVDMVCLSVALPSQLIRATSAIETLQQSGWKGIIEIGGAAFVMHAELALQTGADFYGTDAATTVERATQLLKSRV